MPLKRFFNKVSRKKKSWTELYSIGRGTYGDAEVRHWGEPATLKVGAFCSIASDVTIFLGGNHRVDWISTYPFTYLNELAKSIPGHPTTKGDVIIGNDVWIGAGATILSGVTIGNGAVIGACSVVTRDVPAYSVAAGNPARTVRLRFSEEDVATLEHLAWWDWPDLKINDAIPLLLSGDVAALRAFATAEGLRP